MLPGWGIKCFFPPKVNDWFLSWNPVVCKENFLPVFGQKTSEIYESKWFNIVFPIIIIKIKEYIF